MKSVEQHSDELRIASEATHWLGKLAENRPEDAEAFTDWLMQSPKHVEEYLLTTAFHVELHRYVSQQPQRARWGKSWLAAAAAIALLAVGFGVVNFMSAAPQWYITKIGEQRAITLEEGSAVHLNTDSAVTVKLSAGARDLELQKGEAFFNVAHDALRPFRVAVDGNVIEAVGTAFAVYRRARDIEVWVADGRVTISTGCGDPQEASWNSLAKGRRVVMQMNGCPRTHSIEELSAAEQSRRRAWLDSRLSFNGQPLAEAVAEFNRFNRRKIVIVGAGLESYTVLGTFDPLKPDRFVATIGEAWPVERDMESAAARDDPATIRIRRRQPP